MSQGSGGKNRMSRSSKASLVTNLVKRTCWVWSLLAACLSSQRAHTWKAVTKEPKPHYSVGRTPLSLLLNQFTAHHPQGWRQQHLPSDKDNQVHSCSLWGSQEVQEDVCVERVLWRAGRRKMLWDSRRRETLTFPSWLLDFYWCSPSFHRFLLFSQPWFKLGDTMTKAKVMRKLLIPSLQLSFSTTKKLLGTAPRSMGLRVKHLFTLIIHTWCGRENSVLFYNTVMSTSVHSTKKCIMHPRSDAIDTVLFSAFV